MKRLLRLSLPAALLFILGTGATQVRAGCPSCGSGGWGSTLGGFDAWTFINREPNRANIFPENGFTAYDGMWATSYQAHSNYSPINWLSPPAATAQTVLDKLKEMNIPLVAPEPMFLNKNPRIADNINLPVPRPKKAKSEE